MNATIYGRGRMVIPARVRQEAGITQGDVVQVETHGDGRILLIRLERLEPAGSVKPKIIQRKGKHPVGDLGRPITREEIRAALAGFP